jgi:hypothetical protein
MSRWQFIGIVLVGALGLFGLLATSEPPVYYPAYMELFSDANEPYGQFAEVCPNDILQLNWDIPQGKQPTLNAIPSNNLIPALINKEVEMQGSSSLTVKGKVEITLTYDERFEKIWQTQVVISTDVCAGYPIDIRGNYVGTLEQTQPEVAILNRNLNIAWSNGELVALLNSDVSNILMSCITSLQDDTLSCIEETEGKVTFKLEGKFKTTDFTGTYEGVQKGSSFETAIKGTFSFVKEESP